MNRIGSKVTRMDSGRRFVSCEGTTPADMTPGERHLLLRTLMEALMEVDWCTSPGVQSTDDSFTLSFVLPPETDLCLQCYGLGASLEEEKWHTCPACKGNGRAK